MFNYNLEEYKKLVNNIDINGEYKDLRLTLQGNHLTTAQIFYHLPDYPEILQEYIWQDYDQAPKYPKLSEFLKFWQNKIEGKLHSVSISKDNNKLILPEYRNVIQYNL